MKNWIFFVLYDPRNTLMVKYTNHDFCIDLFETFAESEQS